MKGIDNLCHRRLFNLLRRIIFSIQKGEPFGKLVKNSFYLLSASLVTSVISFFQSIIVARYLGVTQYGLLALVFSYVMIVNQFFDFRIWELITKYGAEYRTRDEKGKLLATIKLGYGIDIFSSITAVIVTVLLSKLVARVVFHRPEIAGIASIYAFSLLVNNISNSSSAVLKVFDRFSWVGAQNVGRSILGISLIGIAVILRWDLRGMILTYLATALISGAVFIALAYSTISKCILRYKVESSLRVLRGRLKEKAKFLFYTNITGFLKMFLDNFDNFILGYFRGPTDVGHYKIGKNFATIFVHLTDPVMMALYPQLSSLWAGNRKKEIRKLVLKVSKIMALFAVGVILLITVFAPQIIHITVGAKYLDSVLPLRIMVWMMLWIVLIWGGILFQSMGRADLFFKTKGAATLIALVLFFILTYKFGVIGTSFSYLSYHISWTFIALFVISRGNFLRPVEEQL